MSDSILSKLASSMNRRDEAPNIALANEIITKSDHDSVKVLVEALHSGNKDVKNDVIKVLYEIGAEAPGMIAGYSGIFLDLLRSSNNRLQWGAMTALSAIASTVPEKMYDRLPEIMDAADKGSVITRDHAMNVLIALAGFPKYAADSRELILAQLRVSPANQLPMYAEKVMDLFKGEEKKAFIQTLTARMADFEKESKRKRISKVIDRLSK